MIRFLNFFCMLLVTLLLLPALALAHPGGEVTLFDGAVRNYDEDVVQANVVDQEVGIGLAAFKADVAAAWDNDAGGVIDFDNATLTFDLAERVRHITAIESTYGASGSGKTITLLNGDNSAWDNIGENSAGGTLPVSGARRLRKSDRGDTGSTATLTNDFVFDIGPISDGSKVVSMGVTAIGRDGSALLYTAMAIFNDGTTFTTALDQVKENVGEKVSRHLLASGSRNLHLPMVI